MVELEEPLQPARMLSLGTSTWGTIRKSDLLTKETETGLYYKKELLIGRVPVSNLFLTGILTDQASSGK